MNNFINSLEQSGIRSMTMKCEKINGINLGQGICDIATSKHIKIAANEAINRNYNTYAPYQGLEPLREAILEKLSSYNRISKPSLDRLLVTHGSTGGFVAALKVLFQKGDEAILFEPFYGYHRQLLELHEVTIKTISIDINNNFSFEPQDILQLINEKTKAIILCNPSNPSGKVFSIKELKQIGEIAIKNNIYILTDEIYEHIIYPPQFHTSIASIPEYAERVIMLSGFSKTYHITGWRIGYAYGPYDIIKKIGLIHDLLYICPPTPLQLGAAAALNLPETYYDDLITTFFNKRKMIIDPLRDIGFSIVAPQGAYYLMADYSNLELPVDSEIAANILLEEAKVSTVPAKYFYLNKELSKNKIRFCFAVSDQKIEQAIQNLKKYFSC